MTIKLPSPSAPLPPAALVLLTRLEQEHVEHVLIGGLAATVHGVDNADTTVVIVPARFERNMDRLARVLQGVGARRRDALAHESTNLSPAGLRQRNRWSLHTRIGELEIDFEPPATAGHLDIFQDARRYALAPQLEVEVAALADLLRIAEMRRSRVDENLLVALRQALGASRSLISQESSGT
jgi:hypothetical protein